MEGFFNEQLQGLGLRTKSNAHTAPFPNPGGFRRSLRDFRASRPTIMVLPLRGFCSDPKNFNTDLKCLKKPESSTELTTETHNPSSRGTSKRLTHVDREGKVFMVDVGGKLDTRRTAVATAVVRLGPELFRMVRANQLKKGDVLAVARVAGIQGAKLTSQLVPLCHNIPLSQVKVSLELDGARFAVAIKAECSAHGKTGVEMEALTAASAAALTVYDMCKAVARDMVIEEVKLETKTGGERGDFHREPNPSN